MASSTERFSDRVADYVRWRPSYPAELLEFLRGQMGLCAGLAVADLGSGTGILSDLLLASGNIVFAVEPNAPMRRAAEERLGGRAGFHSVAGTAEATTLAGASVDWVIAAQAFHWFDQPAARREALRILRRPPAMGALIWNQRRTASTAFLRDYEAVLLRFSTDYANVRHENVSDEAIAAFFGGEVVTRTFEHAQRFDLAGLQGRLLSSSYAPAAGHPDHAPMLAELRRLFDLHRQDGLIAFEYDAVVHCGRVEQV